MNHPVSLVSLARSVMKNREVIWQMTMRNVVGRYRGSMLGLLWSFVNPLVMLSIYTFAFSVVFKARWGIENEGHLDFALILFASLTIFNFFGEIISSSPTLVLGQPNFVKKVIFPLEVLPVITLLTSLVHTCISLGIFVLASAIAHQSLPYTLVFLPVVFLPLALISLGVSFFLASIGVYVRDIGHFVGHMVTVLLFSSPVFYSLERIPATLRAWLVLNPVAYILESARRVMVFGQGPDWLVLGAYSALGILLVVVGYWWFQKTRKGFADVL